ncbi:hypothetical protein H4R18_002540 [Coemansia javaensis]|uniref:Uncharacterized protein n=1 Tax=Coemansia javaensis TaxID=2761396 RepID=A0A9W8HBI7_9FUNG|nr:hypothetical protein H4R18_002540 [Coemansia javaensis]
MPTERAQGRCAAPPHIAMNYDGWLYDGQPRDEKLYDERLYGEKLYGERLYDGLLRDGAGPAQHLQSQQQQQQQQQQPAAVAGDPAVLGRMKGLEDAIALVKSSLDNHASSYYSVASQIAELNARIGRLGIQDRPLALEPGAWEDTASSPVPLGSRDDNDNDDDDNNNDDDGQYTRIQEMISTLIKDADSALGSRTRGTRHCRRRRPLLRDMHAVAEPGASASSGLDDAPTLVGDASTECAPRSMPEARPQSSAARLRPRPQESVNRMHAPRPSSALGVASPTPRSRSLLPRSTLRSARHWHGSACDPAEADDESDSDHSAFSSSIRRRGGGGRQPHSYQSPNMRSFGRYRSGTCDSAPSNSSETCVSPGNRLSREFQPMPMPPVHDVPLAHGLHDLGAPDGGASTTHDFPRLACHGRPQRQSFYAPGGLMLHQAALLRHQSRSPAMPAAEHDAYGQKGQRGRARSNTHSGEVSPTATRSADGMEGSVSDVADGGSSPGGPPHMAAVSSSSSRSTGASGLLNMVGLLYWTLLFTLGALMLDSFLCQTAGKRVVGAVEGISRAEAGVSPDAAGEGASERQQRRPRRAGGAGRAAESEPIGLASAVGRLVRWYVESPELPGAAAQPAHPRSLRARKASASRGSFKHID